MKSGVVAKTSFAKRIVFLCMTLALMVCMALPAFAAEPTAPVVTTEMLSPILDSITANVAVIVPVGIGIFAIVLGVRFIPRIFKMFTRG